VFWSEIFREFIRPLKQQSDDSRVTDLQNRRIADLSGPAQAKKLQSFAASLPLASSG
jgi:hypothetical protein